MNCDDAGGHALDKYGDMIGEGDKGTNGLGHDKRPRDDAMAAYGMPAQPLLLAGWVGRAREGCARRPRRAASREAFQSPGGSKKISNPRGATGAKTAEPAYRPAWSGLRARPHDIVAVHLPNSD